MLKLTFRCFIGLYQAEGHQTWRKTWTVRGYGHWQAKDMGHFHTSIIWQICNELGPLVQRLISYQYQDFILKDKCRCCPNSEQYCRVQPNLKNHCVLEPVRLTTL